MSDFPKSVTINEEGPREGGNLSKLRSATHA
jgi:hypothetical protein